MSDVLLEVRQAMKQERMEKMWKNYGGLIIGALVLLVASTAIHEGYNAWKADQNKKQTVTFLESLDQKDGKSILEKSANLDDSLKILAQMRAANAFEKENNYTNAISIYKDMLENKNAPPEFKSLANYALVRLDTALSADQKVIQLSQIWADESNPWRYHARLDAAVILANSLKNYKDARTQLAALINTESIPKTLKQKATSLDILYSAMQSDQKLSPPQKSENTSQ